MRQHLWGLPIHEIIIPILCWTLFIFQYLYLFSRGAFTNAFENILTPGAPTQPKTAAHFPFLFFSKARKGWVTQNFLTGQASANSTRSVPSFSFRLIRLRDYLRVILFFAGNAAGRYLFPTLFDLSSVVVLGILVVGYTVAAFKRQETSYEKLRNFQMAFLSFLLFVIFFVFLYSTRFALHHQYDQLFPITYCL
jgi:hypothetical protein